MDCRCLFVVAFQLPGSARMNYILLLSTVSDSQNELALDRPQAQNRF